MTELLRTNDVVLLTAIEALLSGAKIEFVVADRHMSALEGSIGALPRRVLVPADQVVKARRVLTEGGLGHALPPG
jgi:NADH:ubiquinone oxidoreductase subunit K